MILFEHIMFSRAVSPVASKDLNFRRHYSLVAYRGTFQEYSNIPK